jgi:hypothetical protein
MYLAGTFLLFMTLLLMAANLLADIALRGPIQGLCTHEQVRRVIQAI